MGKLESWKVDGCVEGGGGGGKGRGREKGGREQKKEVSSTNKDFFFLNTLRLEKLVLKPPFCHANSQYNDLFFFFWFRTPPQKNPAPFTHQNSSAHKARRLTSRPQITLMKSRQVKHPRVSRIPHHPLPPLNKETIDAFPPNLSPQLPTSLIRRCAILHFLLLLHLLGPHLLLIPQGRQIAEPEMHQGLIGTDAHLRSELQHAAQQVQAHLIDLR